ncbi:hypothetical protein GCM10009069_19080 [Algimonas arctica]|uniref:Uncharacterized protein n=1 Tax=Algimonas arctica TaxID=1479486 RepID=A0A8J3CSY8_9PROT|nr:hypothetical protein [Algimonas arctica]GHA96255.1 hypothetical protein GCM10009069_19080 [Algimonas arctica]
MLLRHLTKHVEDQNWFAVGLDFLIVVFGVFIGLQVANWNDVSRAAAKEVAVIEQLQSEFTQTLAEIRTAKTNSDLVLEKTRDVLRIIRDQMEPADTVEFLDTLRSAGSFVTAPAEPITLTELLSAGGLSDLMSPALRTALTRYHQVSDQHQVLGGLMLARASATHDGFHTAIYVNPDFGMNGESLLARYDWDRLPDAREQFQVLLYGKIGLSRNIDELIIRGEAVISELEAALK